MSQPLLRVSQLVRKFGASTVVDDLSFSLEAGACLGVIGPNGAGKTTTIFALGISRAPTMLLALPVLGFVGIYFASLALVFNALAKGCDVFTNCFTLVVTPMTFPSGVYFPIEQMPPWLQAVAQVLPMKAAVDLVRPLVLGTPPTEVLRPAAILAVYAVVGYCVALVLARRRFFK